MFDIRRIRRETGVREHSDRFKPFVRLVIEPTAGRGDTKLYINLKVFNASAVRRMLAFLKLRYEDLGMPHVVDDRPQPPIDIPELIC